MLAVRQGVARVCRLRERYPIASGVRTFPRVAYPNPDRTCPCTSRSSLSARRAAHGLYPSQRIKCVLAHSFSTD